MGLGAVSSFEEISSDPMGVGESDMYARQEAYLKHVLTDAEGQPA